LNRFGWGLPENLTIEWLFSGKLGCFHVHMVDLVRFVETLFFLHRNRVPQILKCGHQCFEWCDDERFFRLSLQDAEVFNVAFLLSTSGPF
jgi:hypothetical protein